MSGEPGKDILKGVSRSFYLTLRLLPAPMRGGAGLAYLIARTSDTIADTPGVPVDDRLGLLAAYAESVESGSSPPAWPVALLENALPAERRLLEQADAILGELLRRGKEERKLIREVIAIIVSGQALDLRRFANATAEHPVALVDDAALEDYTFRVAGCVGAFWTKLGFLTMEGDYSSVDRETLIARGIGFGKALQLVNILRDLPQDLREGRCYLPVKDPSDGAEMAGQFGRWRKIASEWNESGFVYAGSLGSQRLRAAAVLPAMIARETLDLLEAGVPSEKVKVPRRGIYRLLLESLFF